ncbi:SDR family NAD(P)-dependent oxidoreductase [Sphingobium yanoikuyae]|uniref:Short-chain dehydrogenase n=1 Tax=Sphingobium yanoikuyae TaxID=13690 RepID=A0A291MXC8_SPHYA|nr:SDR family NAD(P)-dependent oxidoreductase [Sphingobium yanoikuyae]ATI79568.1 short-chain dehydrogenase [Sphingobium yanoikuyae]
MSQTPKVAVVTGASRGAGQGIATALGQHGCIVYVTGRSEKAGDAPLPGTIYETAAAVTAAGGQGIAVRVDHGDDEQTRALFDRVRAEQGHIDILVNNVAAIHDELTLPGRFWEKPLKLADIITVGIRSSYVASYHAAPMMVDRGQGLIVFTSGSGASHYVYGPGYGAHKVSQDKMAADMAIDLRDTGVTALSIWMGALRTGRLLQLIASDPAKYAYLEKMVETPEFTGHVIWALSQDPALADHAGQTLIGAELAEHYGLRDVGDRQPPSYRQSYGVAPLPQYDRIIR